MLSYGIGICSYKLIDYDKNEDYNTLGMKVKNITIKGKER